MNKRKFSCCLALGFSCCFLSACGSEEEVKTPPKVVIEEVVDLGPSQEEILEKYSNDMSKFVDLVDSIGDPFLNESNEDLIRALELMASAAEKVSTFVPSEEFAKVHEIYAQDTMTVATMFLEMAYHVECYTSEMITERDCLDLFQDLSIELTFALNGTESMESQLLEDLDLNMLYSFYTVTFPDV